jgi:hypothetical protein
MAETGIGQTDSMSLVGREEISTGVNKPERSGLNDGIERYYNLEISLV